jgi:hypothetical protein
MALVDDIRALRTRTVAELTAAHDYYTDTVQVWAFFRAAVATGYTSSYTSPVTSTTTTQIELMSRIPGYIKRELAESTFNNFLAIFEAFFADFVRAWLRAYPQNLLSADPVPVDVILESPDKAAITDFLIDRAIVGVLYKKPADWFAWVEKRLKLGCPAADEIARFAEAKATRDVIMHNRGVVNDVYVTKAGALARYAAGEFIDLPDPYHRDVWGVLLKIVADLAAAVCAKFP